MANDLVIKQGSTFEHTIKYSYAHLATAAITAITKSGQAVVTAAAHGIPLDWQVWIVGVLGMVKVNHQPDEIGDQPKAYYAYYESSSSMRLNLDTTRFSAYSSGGELLYHPPIPLAGYTARMMIREDYTSTPAIHTLTTENGGITLGATDGKIVLTISATATAAFDFDVALYDLEIANTGGVVTEVIHGAVTLNREVTW